MNVLWVLLSGKTSCEVSNAHGEYRGWISLKSKIGIRAKSMSVTSDANY